MLSIQQLIKALRKLQNSNHNGGDLVRKSLKYAAVAGNANSTAMPPITVTSLLVEHDDVTSRPSTTTTTTTTVISPKQQQQQQTSNSSQQSITSTTASPPVSSVVDCGEIGRQQHVAMPPPNISLILYLDEHGSAARAGAAAQTFTTDTNTNLDTVTTTTGAEVAATAKASSYLRRSEQIHNFYQQQLHHFHTQHHQKLYAKQKQTHFAMSSLAAEPLALKQDEYVASAPAIAQATTTTNDSSVKSGHSGNCYDTVEDASNNSSNSSASSASSKPCFNTGLAEILQFMELIGNLKHTKRTGWVLRDVDDCESISGHMYRMSMMTFLLDGTEGLNQIRCMELALVHDLAESLVGDITPFCGVSKCDKRAMEFKAMADICKLIEPRGKRIMELFEEYEHGQSAESKFVKDLDRLDMVMQAFEYEKRDDCLLKHQEFFDSTEGKFKHPFVKKLVDEIYEQRRSLAKAKGATPPPKIEVPSMEEPISNGHSEQQERQQQESSSSSS